MNLYSVHFQSSVELYISGLKSSVPKVIMFPCYYGPYSRLSLRSTEFFFLTQQTFSYALAFPPIHLFSPLLEGGQFHVYLTARAQNAVPRIFASTSN